MLTLLDRPETNGLCLVRRVKWSPDGKHLAAILFEREAGEPRSTILLWNLEKSTRAEVLGTFHSRSMSLTFAAQGRYLAVGIDRHTVRIWDLEQLLVGSNLPLAEAHPANAPVSEYRNLFGSAQVCRFGETGTLAVYRSNRWSLWDLEDPAKTAPEEQKKNYRVDSCATSSDSRVLVFVAEDGVVRRFKLSSGLKSPLILWQGSRCERVVVSRCGERFAVIEGNQVRFGSVSGRNRELRRLEGHEAFVYAAVFGPDHRTLLTGGHDGTTRLWNLDRQKELAQYDWGIGRVTAMDLSPDGSSVVAGGDGNQNLIMWDLE